MKIESLGSMLRGMLVPTFLDRMSEGLSDGQEYKGSYINFLFNFNAFYFDLERMYKDCSVIKLVAGYLISFLNNDYYKGEVVLSKKDGYPLAEQIKKVSELQGYKYCDQVIIDDDDAKLSKMTKKRIENKRICFVDNIITDNFDLNGIKKITEKSNAKLVSCLSIFNYTPASNPVKAFAIFNRNSMKRYSLRPINLGK